jgi:hypothetical protein
MFLGGDTEVNIGLHHTLLADPEHFWHFNNGITAICREIRPKLAGGKSKESGFFNCYDVRIVNGAQTAGSIASAHERSPNDIERARVHVRFIAVGNDAESGLGESRQPLKHFLLRRARGRLPHRPLFHCMLVLHQLYQKRF